MKILVIGESCKDVFIYGKTPRLCPEAPAPVFNPLRVIENGGMATNVYRNLISLGASVNLYTNQNWRSIKKTRYIDDNMNHMFIRVDEGEGTYGRSSLKHLKYRKYDAIIISDYNKGFVTEEDIEYIANKHENVFLDTKKILGPWCKNIKYIKINKDEYENTKHTISPDMFDKLIITVGSDGCRHKDVIYPVPKVETKDSSGAGDTFISALTIKYIESNSIEEAVSFANECATKVVQKRGTSTV